MNGVVITGLPTWGEGPHKPKRQECANSLRRLRRRLERAAMYEEPVSQKVYRWLLKLCPSGFRESYSGPMEQQFREELSESSGGWALAVLWVRVLTDLVVTIPGQMGH